MSKSIYEIQNFLEAVSYLIHFDLELIRVDILNGLWHSLLNELDKLSHLLDSKLPNSVSKRHSIIEGYASVVLII